MIIRKPITKPVMRSVLTSLSTAASEAASALAVPPSLRSLLFHDDGTATKYPAYYTEEEWAEHSHLLKDYSIGVGNLREKRLGYCYDFDGVNDYVNCGPIDILYNAPAFTLSMWIKFNGSIPTTEKGIITKGRSGVSGNVTLQFNSTGIYYHVNNLRTGTVSRAGLLPDIWYLLTLSYDALNQTNALYINAEIKPWLSNSGTYVNLPSSTQNWAIAAVSNGLTYYSVLAAHYHDVRIYNTALTAGQVAQLYTGTEPAVAPIAHYPLQEESGTTAYDISGNGHHGTILNAVTSGVGSIHQPDAGVPKSFPNDEGFNSYYRFNGTSDYISIPTLPAQTQTTWSVWAKREGDNWNMVMSSGSSGAELRFNNNRPEIIWNNETGYILSSSTIDSNWHHYVVTAIQGEIKLYIDGTLIGTDNTFNYVSQNNIDIGRRYNDAATAPYHFPGFIRDVYVYDRVLTSDEIAFLYNASGPNPGTANLLVHYPLIENALDVSGNNRNGTIFGPVLNYVPAATATTDALGGTLTYTGRCPNYGLAKGPAWQGDGSTVVVALGAPIVPALDDFSIDLYMHLQPGLLKRNAALIGDNNSRAIINDDTYDGFRWLVNNNNNLGFRVTSAGMHRVQLARTGDVFRLRVWKDGALLASSSRTHAGYSYPQASSVLLGGGSNGATETSMAYAAVTTGGITTTYSPIEGTRDVAVTKSDGTYSVIADAVKNGALATLYSEGDGSWQLPEIANGAHFDGTGLYPAAPGASVAANGNALNIPANKHPIGLLVDRTGGVIAPIDYKMGTNNYQNEEFNTIPSEVTLNKRGLSIYAADRYGASLENIQS